MGNEEAADAIGSFFREWARLVLPDRHDGEGLQRIMADPAARVLPIFQEKNLVIGDDPVQPVILPLSRALALPERARGLTLLGILGGAPLFTADVSDSEQAPHIFAGEGRFTELRTVLSQLDEEHATLLGYARAMTYWHSRHRYCGVCGAPTHIAEAGHVRTCRESACAAQIFPRTDPAVIVLAVLGEKCLLGRQAAWPKGIYSPIAGFVEPGESLEEAAARELFEETGVRAGNMRYLASQSWPFPASLMVAFTAEAESESIDKGDEELEDARWFSREDIVALCESGEMRMPMGRSISFRLLESWFDAKSDVPLREAVKPSEWK